jgi:hypothetical protein
VADTHTIHLPLRVSPVLTGLLLGGFVGPVMFFGLKAHHGEKARKQASKQQKK